MSDAQDWLDSISEAQLMEKVVALAQARKWKVHHCRPARTEKGWRTAISGDPGFVDLVLARGGVVLFVELKNMTNSASANQLDWLDALGENTEIWRPSSWRRIEEMLA